MGEAGEGRDMAQGPPDSLALFLVPTLPPAGCTGRALPWQRDALQDGVQLRGECVLRARVEAAAGV